jgi:hypothetical protein
MVRPLMYSDVQVTFGSNMQHIFWLKEYDGRPLKVGSPLTQFSMSRTGRHITMINGNASILDTWCHILSGYMDIGEASTLRRTVSLGGAAVVDL